MFKIGGRGENVWSNGRRKTFTNSSSEKHKALMMEIDGNA